jgi:hypothetical protein
MNLPPLVLDRPQRAPPVVERAPIRLVITSSLPRIAYRSSVEVRFHRGSRVIRPELTNWYRFGDPCLRTPKGGGFGKWHAATVLRVRERLA